MEVIGVKGLRSILFPVLAGCAFIVNDAAWAASDADGSCRAGAQEPPPAHRLPAYTASDIAAMFARPRANADLLSNLKIVLDQRLLAQPAFFEGDVLRALFNTNDVQWVEPGTPDVTSERLVKPTRIARVRFEASSPFAGIQASVGVNHKCLEGRAHPSRPGVVIPAHTYDSGYIYLRVERPAAITVGDVRRAFGSNAGELHRQCRSPISLYYQGPQGPSPEAFRLHAAEFRPSEVGYEALCQTAAPGSGLPDEHPISDVWIRLLQEDYTLPDSVSP
jgi:hypothetical protein